MVLILLVTLTVWVSEVMLQQTRVAAVIDKYKIWMKVIFCNFVQMSYLIFPATEISSS